MKTKLSITSIIFVAILGFLSLSRAAEMPSFRDDKAADSWFRTNLPTTYNKWAKAVDARGGYRLTHPTGKLDGNFYDADGHRCIGLPDNLKGPGRYTQLIYHVASAYLEPEHQAVDSDAAKGKISSDEFVHRHMLINYESLKLHRTALIELEGVVGTLPPEMFTAGTASKATDYKLPNFDEWVKSQDISHYKEWFLKQKNRNE